MLEPLLMLTVLNCVFMFSSTMTTCALWWQYRRNRNNCPAHGRVNSKLNVKKTKSGDHRTLKDDGKRSAGEKLGKSVGKQRDKSDTKSSKDGKKEKKERLLGILMKGSSQGVSTKTNVEGMKTSEKLTSTDDIKHLAPLPSSDPKSTIVMEVSTIQKFTQVLDSDRDSYQSRTKPKGTLTYRISPENERKVQLIVENDAADREESMKKE